VEYIITKNESGKTVKEILFSHIGLSCAFVKHLKFIDNGIMLNGEHVTVRKIVNTGDVLYLATEDSQFDECLTPTDIPLDIVFENDFIIIPNKPPFMPTHPSHLHHGDTLADALAFRYKEKNKPFVFRPINRLDRNTSGLTLIAKDRITAAKLANAMKSGQIRKQYLALLKGEISYNEGIIETYLKRTDASIIVRRVCEANEGGDYALTKYKVLKRGFGHTLVLASPQTGRTHQLRVHFAHLGYPIVGDDIYGYPDSRISRHALHALKLTLPDVKTNEMISFCAPLPDDIKNIIIEIFGECDDSIFSHSFGLI